MSAGLSMLHVYSNDLMFTGVPADARYLLGVSYPSSERQHVLTM